MRSILCVYIYMYRVYSYVYIVYIVQYVCDVNIQCEIMSGDFCPGSSILISNMGQKVAMTLIDTCQSTMAGGATAWFHAWVPFSEPTEPYQIYICFSMRLSYAMYPVHTQSDVSIHGRFYHAALASRFPRRTPSLDKLPNGKFHKPLCRFYRNWHHTWANSLASWWTYHVPSTCLKSTMGNDSIISSFERQDNS